jgi:hypothetical protein
MSQENVEILRLFYEAIGLTWGNLNLGERPRVLVREQVYQGERRPLKSGRSRRDIPLSPGMASRLIALRRDAYAGEDRPVFASQTGTELMPSNVYRRVLAPAAISVGFSVKVMDKDGQQRVARRCRFTPSGTRAHRCSSRQGGT